MPRPSNPVKDTGKVAPRDLRELFSNTIQTLTQTLGLRRCALFLKASEGSHLGCVFAHGFEGTAVVRGLTVLVDDSHLPRRLLQHAGSFLWVRDTQASTARQQLPAVLASLVLDTGLALGVVDMAGQPKGLWWVDTGSANRPLDAAPCAAYKQFSRSFGADFTRLARPATAAPNPRREATAEPA